MLVVLVSSLSWLAGCGPRTASGPLPQRGYVWQRAWTPAVGAAVGEAARHLQGVVLLGAELRAGKGEPVVARAEIDWAVVRRAGTPCAVALRVAPFGGPFATDDAVGRAITKEARALLSSARAAGVSVAEFQLDFDCAQSKLGPYRAWVRAVRAEVQPVPLAITTLPTWLGARDFAALVREADAFVLQVHSVPTRTGTELCDPVEARAWVRRAARLGRPFSVALPTYRCLAGYGPKGDLLGLAMEGTQPAWPPGTRTLELAAPAEKLAALLHEWQRARPVNLREILWYRVPVAGDVRNWRWPTLDAVMAGRAPLHRLEVRQTGENPRDLSLYNAGEADEELRCAITATWSGARPQAEDALAGWSLVTSPGRAVFTPKAEARLRLPPGEQRNIGWLRYATETLIHVEVAEP